LHLNAQRYHEAHGYAIHLLPSPDVSAWQCTAPCVARNCTQFLEVENVPVFPMVCILTWNVNPFSMFGMLWINVHNHIFQFPPIYSNIAQPLKRSGTTFHWPQSTAWSTLCEVQRSNH
jgi:hypothetical protein